MIVSGPACSRTNARRRVLASDASFTAYDNDESELCDGRGASCATGVVEAVVLARQKSARARACVSGPAVCTVCHILYVPRRDAERGRDSLVALLCLPSNPEARSLSYPSTVQRSIHFFTERTWNQLPVPGLRRLE
jgi:hypothetical protein